MAVSTSWNQDTSGLGGKCLWVGLPPDCLDALLTEQIDWACTEAMDTAFLLALGRTLNTEEMDDICIDYTSPSLPTTSWTETTGT